MDPSYQYHQQYSNPQPYPPTAAAAPPPSEAQSYNQQPPQSDYLYHHQYNQAQQYPFYPQTAHYSNAYPQQQTDQEPVPIHPPGVAVQSDPAPYDYGQTHDPYQQNSYYTQAGLEQQQQQLGYSDPGLQGQHWQGNVGLIPFYSQPQTDQLQHNGAGRSGGRGGGGRGPPIRGRGRGRGRGGAPAVPRAPPQMAWCELCRVDCNTPEILEKHKSGKKHNKNLKVQMELQTLAQKTQAEAAATLPGNVVGPNETNPPPQQPVEGQGSGLKRKKKSGPASKRKKVNDGSSNGADPPKEHVPFICELCNVKCESTVVFDSHLKGKKHLFHLQRFQEHQATLGQAALQALYPALEAALLQALSQQQQQQPANQNAPVLDQQVLQLLQAFLPQAGGPPAIAPLQTQEDAAVPSSTLGNGSQNVPTDVGTESQPEPEMKIEGPDSMNGQQTHDGATA